MALKQKKLRVYLGTEDAPVEHAVTITLADQLRGELEAKKNGIPLDLAIHITTVFAWAAMTRTGAYAGSYQQFANVDCLDWANAGDDDPEPVDPTQPAAPSDSA